MTEPTRRTILRRSAVVGGAALTATVPALTPAQAEPASTPAARAAAITVRTGDPRYPQLIRGTNKRWVGSPDYIRLVSSADQVVEAVREAVAERQAGGGAQRWSLLRELHHQ